MQDTNVKTFKVTLKQAHTHAGEKHPAGKEIDVQEHDKTWLEENGVIDPPTGITKRGAIAEEK